MKLMIVDDSQTMIRILSKAAKMTVEDLELFYCHNGQEALDCLKENTDISLILLDINMPVMDGKEFLKIIRNDSQYNDLKIIIQTTETGDSEIKEMVKLGISGYLTKPYQTQKAIDLIKQLAPIVGYKLLKN